MGLKKHKSKSKLQTAKGISLGTVKAAGQFAEDGAYGAKRMPFGKDNDENTAKEAAALSSNVFLGARNRKRKDKQNSAILAKRSEKTAEKAEEARGYVLSLNDRKSIAKVERKSAKAKKLKKKSIRKQRSLPFKGRDAVKGFGVTAASASALQLKGQSEEIDNVIDHGVKAARAPGRIKYGLHSVKRAGKTTKVTVKVLAKIFAFVGRKIAAGLAAIGFLGAVLIAISIFFVMTACILFSNSDKQEDTAYDFSPVMDGLPDMITEEMLQGAYMIKDEYRIPPSLTIAQIILESSGTYPGHLSKLAYECNNLFGMKGIGSAGSKTYKTSEQTKGGTVYYITAQFAKYSSQIDSIKAYGALLNSERYQKYVSKDATVKEWAHAVVKGGYATDVSYESKIMSIVEKYDLTKLDKYSLSDFAVGQGDAGTEGAIAWAEKIANDNAYVYGGSRCYTCSGGTKEYVCATFVKAAYAHGAGDKEMLKWCKSGRNGMVADLHAAMKASENWKSLGRIPMSKMQPGDVIVYGVQHVELYYGKGKKIGAHNSRLPAAEQISVNSVYSGWTDVMRYSCAGTGVLIWPVPGQYMITSGYGWRICPFHGREYHAAIDIGAPMGTKVIAADGGKIESAVYNGGFGNQVVIDHGNGLKTYYNHLSRFAVSKGQTVAKGSVIAYVGSTGSSTGPHLDFRIYKNGKDQDPLKYVKKQ